VGDTWIWDGGLWRNIPASSAPPPRFGAASATLNGRVVLFGGRDSSMSRNDTWTWDGVTWTQEHPNPASLPNPRYRATAATLGSVVVLFGGQDDSGPFGDTWTWDGTNWTPLNISGPTPRSGASMTTL